MRILLFAEIKNSGCSRSSPGKEDVKVMVLCLFSSFCFSLELKWK